MIAIYHAAQPPAFCPRRHYPKPSEPGLMRVLAAHMQPAVMSQKHLKIFVATTLRFPGTSDPPLHVPARFSRSTFAVRPHPQRPPGDWQSAFCPMA
ncbi:hypothetical protein JNJ66_05825 [Candidatus Saccharibacteria bacterium]|nr:hypothetical protein [Candidatus Saccharibacteria bacterium]